MTAKKNGECRGRMSRGEAELAKKGLKDGDLVKITSQSVTAASEVLGEVWIVYSRPPKYHVYIDEGEPIVVEVEELRFVEKVVNEVIMDGYEMWRVVVDGRTLSPGFESQKVAETYFNGIKAGEIENFISEAEMREEFIFGRAD